MSLRLYTALTTSRQRYGLPGLRATTGWNRRARRPVTVQACGARGPVGTSAALSIQFRSPACLGQRVGVSNRPNMEGVKP